MKFSFFYILKASINTSLPVAFPRVWSVDGPVSCEAVEPRPSTQSKLSIPPGLVHVHRPPSKSQFPENNFGMSSSYWKHRDYNSHWPSSHYCHWFRIISLMFIYMYVYTDIIFSIENFLRLQTSKQVK
jgi:hypothetical protein